MCIYCVCTVYLLCIQCVLCVSNVYLLCMYCVLTVYLLCIQCVSIVYVLCIKQFFCRGSDQFLGLLFYTSYLRKPPWCPQLVRQQMSQNSHCLCVCTYVTFFTLLKKACMRSVLFLQSYNIKKKQVAIIAFLGCLFVRIKNCVLKVHSIFSFESLVHSEFT